MKIEAVTTEIPWRPEHVMWSLVEASGKMWVVTAIDPASGITRVERAEREGGHHVDAGYYLETSPMPSLPWPVICGALAVFTFLALMTQDGVALSGLDVLGVIVGFCIIVLMLTRREQRRRGRHYGRWYI